MMNSPIDNEMAKRRTSVWSAKSTPSTVASNGPIWKMTVEPARVKTLTSTTEMAIGSVSNSEIRPNGSRTPARQASPSISAMIAIGPMYPPRTNAPIEPTVPMTAFVSGLNRW